MYIKKYNENFTTNTLICIDIQEEYKDAIYFKLYEFTDFLNNYTGDIYYIYNGHGIGGPELSEICMWLVDNGLEESKLDEISFQDKEYGFLRSYMDNYSDIDGLIELINYMISNNYNDSRNVQQNKYENFNNTDIVDFLKMKDAIYLDDKVFKLVKNLPYSFEICGGGQFECLKELEIVFDVLKKNYTRIDKYIY